MVNSEKIEGEVVKEVADDLYGLQKDIEKEQENIIKDIVLKQLVEDLEKRT